MKKLISLVLVLGFMIFAQAGSACDITENNTFKKIIEMRNYIQKQLNLSSEQEQKRQLINQTYKPKFNEKIKEIDNQIIRLKKLADSEICTIEQVNIIKKEFQIKEKELFKINQSYEKEFNSILSIKQRIKYAGLKQQNRKILKKELKDEISKQKSNVLIPNPWIECNQDLEKAKSIAGFAFPLKLSNIKVQAMKGMIEITYPIDEKRMVIVRKSSEFGRKVNEHGLLDISGDYNKYPVNEDAQVYDCVWFNLRRDNDKIYVANFSAETGLYSINCKKGLTMNEIKQIFKIIEKIETRSLYENMP